jgi:pyruvate,water dikinase
MKPLRCLLVAVLLVGCGEIGNGEHGHVCKDDGHELGPPCLNHIETAEDFARIAIVNTQTGKPGGTKFMLPASDDPGLLPLLFQNSKRFRLHICFLCCAFPDIFGPADNCQAVSPEDCLNPSLTPADYLQLIMRRDTRSYYSGAIHYAEGTVEGVLYGFELWVDMSDPDEQLEMKEVRDIYNRMHAEFVPEKLVYMPIDEQAKAKARTWIDPDFPVYLGFDDVDVEVYTSGVAYGRVRRFTLQQMQSAINRGELGWQDIVVVDRVPFDVETVIAGIVTGGRQWELSHVNVRMARRGTPNLYVKNPLEALEGYEGQLVRLEATRSAVGGDDRYTVEEATLQEAEAWWAEHRPDIGSAPAVDRDYRALDDLLEMDTDDDPVPLVGRVGGKSANLAKLYDFLPAEYRVPGFGIPFAYFEDFMEGNTILDQRVDPPEEVSYREYVGRLVEDQKFRTDTAYRRELLWDLRTRMRYEAQLDPALVSALAQRIREVFGDTGVRVRFRSSSNVEDALEFSGAGLYNSTTVCADDSLDPDRDGPSICDLDQEEERTIERGLLVVWASLYNARAWEERDWYQVPQAEASMGILVTEAFPDEKSNGVAFTGNPQKSTDNRYLINAQLGDEPVVGNDPRMMPERDYLQMDESGQVEKIYRSRSSVLAEPGVYVLSDEQLDELGALMFVMDRDYPLDTEGYLREQALLDFEFKVDSTGQLKIKQVRPFLDKCRGVICNQPPDDYCQDASTLIDYRSWGNCDAQTGGCRYEYDEKECANGCQDGACLP